MNILYLNHYAGSPALGMEFRPYYLAREWVRAGHRVQIVAAYLGFKGHQPFNKQGLRRRVKAPNMRICFAGWLQCCQAFKHCPRRLLGWRILIITVAQPMAMWIFVPQQVFR